MSVVVKRRTVPTPITEIVVRNTSGGQLIAHVKRGNPDYLGFRVGEVGTHHSAEVNLGTQNVREFAEALLLWVYETE